MYQVQVNYQMLQPQTSLPSFQRDFQFKVSLIRTMLLYHGLSKISKAHQDKRASLKIEFKMPSRASSNQEETMEETCKPHLSVRANIKLRPSQSSIWWILQETSWVSQRLKFHQFSHLFLANLNHNAVFLELEAITTLHILHSTDNKNKPLLKYLQSLEHKQGKQKMPDKVMDKKKMK